MKISILAVLKRSLTWELHTCGFVMSLINDALYIIIHNGKIDL